MDIINMALDNIYKHFQNFPLLIFAPMYPERSCESLSVYCTCVPRPSQRFLWSRRGGQDGRGCKEHGAPFNLIGGRVVGGGGASALKIGGP